MLHIPIVHACDVSKQIPGEKKLENVIKQLVHMSAVRSSRYEALGKFGEHSRSQSCSQLRLKELLRIFQRVNNTTAKYMFTFL